MPTDPLTEPDTVAVFARCTVVELVKGPATVPDAEVVPIHTATVRVTRDRVFATDGRYDWTWLVQDLREVLHSPSGDWTILNVSDVENFGIEVPARDRDAFRSAIDTVAGITPPTMTDSVLDLTGEPPAPEPRSTPEVVATEPESYDPTVLPEIDEEPAPAATSVFAAPPEPEAPAEPSSLPPPPSPPAPPEPSVAGTPPAVAPPAVAAPVVTATAPSPGPVVGSTIGLPPDPSTSALKGLDAREISAWFGDHQVLDRVSLNMLAGEVTALIGPSGCGKSTFLRILNRMHEMIPGAAMAGEVLLDGVDVYDPQRKLTDARRQIGMVFQKPNPFPAMSIYDNVLASFRLTGFKASAAQKDAVVESCLSKAGLWSEVKDRLRQPGGGLSGGQQQRLCIARALAIQPDVLLMDEPCSALDPTSTRRIEETIHELRSEVTIVIVTHNMQQAARVSDQCAFFLAAHGTPGVIVEHGMTDAMFSTPQDRRTDDYVNGRFG